MWAKLLRLEASCCLPASGGAGDSILSDMQLLGDMLGMLWCTMWFYVVGYRFETLHEIRW